MDARRRQKFYRHVATTASRRATGLLGQFAGVPQMTFVPTQPTPWQQCWLGPQRAVCVVHVPSLHAGRLHSTPVPPSSGNASGLTVLAQSLSAQHSAQVPVSAQQSDAPVVAHCLFEQQSAHSPVVGQQV